MFLEIPTVTRCCFCAPLRYGLLVFAYLKAVAGMVILAMCLIFTIIFISWLPDEVVYISLMIVVIAFLGLDAVFNGVLISGAHKSDPSLLRHYYRYGIAIEAVVTVLSLIWLVYEMCTMRRPQNMSSWSTFAAISSCATSVLIAHAYLLILTHSAIVKFKSNSRFRFVNHTSDPECYLQPTYEEGT